MKPPLGTFWKTNDSVGKVRYVKVVGHEHQHALIENVETGNRTKALHTRFGFGHHGYIQITDPPPMKEKL